MKKDWQTYALLALGAIAWWFVTSEISDFKKQDKNQWKEAAKTRECYMAELAKIKERLSHIEGFHQAERKP